MISFHFKINDSFKTYSTHPITVPKSQVNYSDLSAKGLDKGDLTIIWPKGERARGHMYYGEAGYGPYFQIRTYGEGSPPQYLTEGEQVLVLLVKDAGLNYAIVEYKE